MSYYFWLGDYHPYADEDERDYRLTDTGVELIEDDGFITTHGLTNQS